MQFKTLIVATLATAVVAQDPASVSAFQSAASSYLNSLLSDSSFIGQAAQLATVNPALIGSLQGLASQTISPAQLTAPPAFISGLPSPLSSLFNSVYLYESSLASSYGVLSVTAAPSGSAPGASATSALNSRISSATASAGSVTGAAGSAISSQSSAVASLTSRLSSGMAAAPTGVAVMGAMAGAVGLVAALL